jgi:beta-1,4-mannosyltransferase
MSKLNPFPGLLADSLESRGWRVDDNEPGKYLRTAYDAVIIHWPDHFSTTHSLPVAWVRTGMFFSLLSYLKLRGARVVRIVHDVDELHRHRRLLRRINRRLSTWLTDQYVFLSASSREAFAAKFPELASPDHQTLFHPHFRGHATAPAAAAPARAALRFVGDIRVYKGLDRFLALYAKQQIATPLEIIGHCDEPEYAATIRTLIDKAREAGCTIDWDDRRPGHDELDTIIAQSAAIVLPYTVCWNSGMAVKVLEHSTALLCADLPLFREIGESVGPWITCYKPDGSNLAAQIDSVIHYRVLKKDADMLSHYLDSLSWDSFAAGFEGALA